MIRTRVIRLLNALMALVFVGVLTAGFYQEWSKNELPCPLCYLQRLGMIGVALGALMNLRFGIQIRHYAFSLLSALLGGGIALRQIALHVCPGFSEFGTPVWGWGLYTWSFVSFFCSVLAIILFLFLHKSSDSKLKSLTWFDKFAFLGVGLLIVSNIVTVLFQCQFGPCHDVPWP